jgi:hypothetical protein
MKRNHDNSESKQLLKLLEEKKVKISKAKKVRSLLQKQKGLIKKKQSLTQFDEPVLDLYRRDGRVECFEKATAGKLVYTHSNGKEMYMTLRPGDQYMRDYGGRKVRWYVAHEDRPFAGFENPILDSETVMLGYEKTKATDLKYQERIAKLKNASKMTWVWIILAILGGLALLFLLTPGEFWDRMFKTGSHAVANKEVVVPSVASLFYVIKNRSK